MCLPHMACMIFVNFQTREKYRWCNQIRTHAKNVYVCASYITNYLILMHVAYMHAHVRYILGFDQYLYNLHAVRVRDFAFQVNLVHIYQYFH